MNKLNREDLLLFLKIAIIVALLVVAIRFFINFLPYIIIILIILIIYDSLKKNGSLTKRKEKNKDSNIVDAEIINEKKDR